MLTQFIKMCVAASSLLAASVLWMFEGLEWQTLGSPQDFVVVLIIHLSSAFFFFYSNYLPTLSLKRSFWPGSAAGLNP